MAAIFIEYNQKYKGKIPKEFESVVKDLKTRGFMRVERPVAKQIMNIGIGKWISRDVGRRREQNKLERSK